MEAKRAFIWLIAGVMAWYAIRLFSPAVSGVILATFVVGALVMMGPELRNIPRR